MASATCLARIAQTIEDDVVDIVMPFINKHIRDPDWRRREASTLAFGSILEGPDQKKLEPIMALAMGVMIEHMADPAIQVKDTAAWTIGRIWCVRWPAAVGVRCPCDRSSDTHDDTHGDTCGDTCGGARGCSSGYISPSPVRSPRQRAPHHLDHPRSLVGDDAAAAGGLRPRVEGRAAPRARGRPAGGAQHLLGRAQPRRGNGHRTCRHSLANPLEP